MEEVVAVNKLLMRSYTIYVSMEDYIALQRKEKVNYSGGVSRGISNWK